MSHELLTQLLGAALNLAIAFCIVRFVYYPVTQDRRYILIFLTFSGVTYFILGLLISANLGIGVGFGLFAIFSVLRYRTDTIPVREMTYLFVLIALAVINSILASHGDFTRILVCNGIIMGLLFILEKGWGLHSRPSQEIIYDRIELILPENREQLLADLEKRTGRPIQHVHIGRIDFIRDRTELVVSYKA